MEFRGGGSNSLTRRVSAAYTLSEIVIVMLIISVVVAVTIGVTKKKLESTVSYTYYSAYESLKDVSRSLLADFNPNSDKYKADIEELNFWNKFTDATTHSNYISILNSFSSQPALAACKYDRRTGCYNCGLPMSYPGPFCGRGILCGGQCWDCPDSTCPHEWTCPEGYKELQEGCGKICADGSVANTPRGEKCPEELCDPNAKEDCERMGGQFYPSTCSCECNDNDYDKCIDAGGQFNFSTCSCNMSATCPITECPSGQHLVDADKSTCKCVADEPSEPDEPASVCNPGDTPPACGQQCVDGQWESIAGFSKTCNDTQEWRDLPDCKCVPIARSLPRNGQKFCEMFEGRVNTNSGDCDGSAISTTTTDFSDKTPDLVLRNGIRIYNLHSNPRKINDLQGNKSGFTISVDPKDLLLQHAVVNGGSLQLDKVQINQQLNQSGASINVNKYEVKNNLSFLPAEIIMRKPLSLFPILSGLFEQKAYARCWTDITGKRVCDGPFEGDLWNGAAQVTPGGNNAGNLNPVNPGLCATNSAMLSECKDKGGTWNSSTCKCDIPEDPEPDEPDEPDPPTPPNPNTPQVNKVQIDTGEYGYTVYVDIDGDKGSSTLWEDVFPFYITLSGQVVPAYNTVDGTELGGSSNEYLQTSVQYEKINNHGRRTVDWLSKSVSYKEGACGSGFIDSSTPYCSGVSELPECSSGTTGSKCTLKTVRPIKFF